MFNMFVQLSVNFLHLKNELDCMCFKLVIIIASFCCKVSCGVRGKERWFKVMCQTHFKIISKTVYQCI